MSYNAIETSRYSGAPVEMYNFVSDVSEWNYTSADVTLTYLGRTYEPDVITRSQLDQSQESQAGNVEVTVPRDNPVADLFIPYLPINPIGLTIYRKQRTDTEVVTIFIGKVVSVQFNDSDAVLTCEPTSKVFQKSIPMNNYQKQCNHALYSPTCGVDKSAYAYTGTVTALTASTLTINGLATHGDNYYQSGWVERSNGDVRFITGQIGNVATLHAPFPDIQVSEIVKVYPGCDRTEDTCRLKFNNLVNHLGFARIPTRNPFSGSLT